MKTHYRTEFGDAVAKRIGQIHANTIPANYEIVGLVGLGTCEDLSAVDKKLGLQVPTDLRVGPPKAGTDLKPQERVHLSAIAGGFARANGIPDPFNATTNDMRTHGVVGVYAKPGTMATVSCDPVSAVN